MGEQVTIRVRPGENIRFPRQCVSCGQPAGDRLRLVRRRGQVTRKVEAPLCADCARQLARRSGQEEQLARLSWPAASVAGLAMGLLASLALPLNSWLAHLTAGLAFGLAGGALVRWFLGRRAEAAELPEKRAIRQAAQIVDFTWRDMTLEFRNIDIANRVREMNETAAATVANGTPDGSEAAEEEPKPAAEVSVIDHPVDNSDGG